MTKKDIIDTWWKSPARLYHVIKIEGPPDVSKLSSKITSFIGPVEDTTILVHAHIVKGAFTATTEEEQDYVNDIINDPSRYATSSLMKYRTGVNNFIESISKDFVRITKAEAMICLM